MRWFEADGRNAAISRVRCRQTRTSKLPCRGSPHFPLFPVMAYKLFCISIVGGDMDDLNVFLSTHRIVEKKWDTIVQDGINYQVCRVEYIESAKDRLNLPWRGGNADNNSSFSKKYPDGLSDEQQRIFDVLRDERRDIAKEEQVQPFVVFTNEQLGEMIKNDVKSLSALKKIPQIGDTKVSKYGKRMLDALVLAREMVKAPASSKDTEPTPSQETEEKNAIPDKPDKKDADEAIGNVQCATCSVQ